MRWDYPDRPSKSTVTLAVVVHIEGPIADAFMADPNRPFPLRGFSTYGPGFHSAVYDQVDVDRVNEILQRLHANWRQRK